ncbi:hypothetical protein HWV62_26168 [Athelia sp. TMB]|nr:hypothetical protein HWV62_26168 [Athelia sp. TMB]
MNVTSALHAPATSALSATMNTTTAIIARSCDDIHTCRTLYSIVQTCLATIFACVWVAVHRNIPAPRTVPDPNSNPGLIAKSARWLWSKLCDQRQPVIVFCVTLMAPEWVLAWAVRQRLRAHQLAEELEMARTMAMRNWAREHPESDKDRGVEVSGRGSSENLLGKRPSTISEPSHLAHTEKQCAWLSAMSVGKLNQAWKTAHGFFVVMGGYQACDENGPIHPLDPDEVVKLVRDGRLVPPTADELSNQSNGDVLSKSIAVLQTVWFVVQCIARLVGDLPLTNLEVMTLAYTVMTVAMYVAWWDKPLNVSCAIRVPGVRVEGKAKHRPIWVMISFYIIGGQDGNMNLDYLQRVPTFWAGNAETDDFIKADIIALLVAMAFGAVHCIAWSYAFRSRAELLMWRASAIAIIAIPAGLLVGLVHRQLAEI